MPPEITEVADASQVKQLLVPGKRQVVSFFGYSGTGYEDEAALLRHADAELAKLDPQQTIVSIGATAMGIGAVYSLAKRRGFMTIGIVSSQAKEQGVPLSPCVDRVFYVHDAQWGGYLPGTTTLSPTSQAIVQTSDVMIAIGGGIATRDEMLEGRKLKRSVKFIPADMNHCRAREKVVASGQPEPTDFRGAAHRALMPVL